MKLLTSALLILICISIFPFFKALFANSSTCSFPFTPTCAGTHINCTCPPWFVILVTDWRTSYNTSWRLFEWKDLKLSRTEDESEHIRTFSCLVFSTHLNATNTATISTVYTPKKSDVLLLIPIPLAGIATPYPVTPVSGFLEPSRAGRYTGSYRIPVFIFLTIWIFKISQYRCHLNNVRNATLLERGLFSLFIVSQFIMTLQISPIICHQLPPS